MCSVYTIKGNSQSVNSPTAKVYLLISHNVCKLHQQTPNSLLEFLTRFVLKEKWEEFSRSILKETSIAASIVRHILPLLMISFPRYGKAYLFDKVVNVTVGEKEERMMITGMHTVVDIFCVSCGSIVGWKYEAAHEKSQKYKEGKFILERYKVMGPDGSLYYIAREDAEE